MLARNYRLRSSKDIARVYSRGKYAGIGIASLKVLHTGLPGSRVVVVVGKKVSNKATVRNRLRRRVLSIIAAEWKTVPVGYDIVITVHKDLGDITPTQLQSDIKHLLRKANLINV